MKFWLDKGIDGFRMDAFQFVAKDPTFPPMPGLTERNYANAYNHGPHLHDYLQEINREVLSHYNVMTVAEGAGRNVTEAMLFVVSGASRLPHYLDVPVAHKTGDWPPLLANDVGIVNARSGPIVVVVCANNITGSYGEAEDGIGRLGRLIVDYFDGAR